MSESIDEYEKHLRAKGNRPGSIGDTVYRLKRFFAPALSRQFRRIDQLEAAAMYRVLTEAYAVDSHRNMLAEAKTFAKWCVGQGWMTASPLDAVVGIGRRKKGKPQLRWDESKKLLEECEWRASRGDAGAVAVMMALLLGMRIHEIVERTVRDLDCDGNVLWIPSSKTEAGRRTLHVPGMLRAHLVKLATKGKEPTAPLMGAWHWPDWVNDQVRRLCELAGVPVVPAHGLRGTHATLALETGQSGAAVAASLGHTNEAVTRGTYAREGAGQAAATMRVVNGGKR